MLYSLKTDAGSQRHFKHTGWRAFTHSLRILGRCIKEAPEFGARKRKVAAGTGQT